MNPKAIKVSMTNEEREYLLTIIKMHRKELINDMNKEKLEARKTRLLSSLALETKLIEKINK